MYVLTEKWLEKNYTICAYIDSLYIVQLLCYLVCFLLEKLRLKKKKKIRGRTHAIAQPKQDEVPRSLYPQVTVEQLELHCK